MYRWVDHTAELQLELEADSERGVFREALVALSALFSERTDQIDVAGGPVRRRVSVNGPDRDVLLAEWLGELAYLAEAENFLPEAAEDLELTRDAVEATVRGRRASPPHLVKAVTYHRLGVWQEDGTWRARVILDV